jgi:hypothetical protein
MVKSNLILKHPSNPYENTKNTLGEDIQKVSKLDWCMRFLAYAIKNHQDFIIAVL